jgi:fructosamine-3-kinase
VTGIIDVEWAIAGHTENDFIKLELWDFKKVKEARDAFFTGYLNYGYISPDYPERKQLYELWHWINMVNISYEISNQVWLKSNLLSLENFLKVLK